MIWTIRAFSLWGSGRLISFRLASETMGLNLFGKKKPFYPRKRGGYTKSHQCVKLVTDVPTSCDKTEVNWFREIQDCSLRAPHPVG
jgi:hypothetical protein